MPMPHRLWNRYPDLCPMWACLLCHYGHRRRLSRAWTAGDLTAHGGWRWKSQTVDHYWGYIKTDIPKIIKLVSNWKTYASQSYPQKICLMIRVCTSMKTSAILLGDSLGICSLYSANPQVSISTLVKMLELVRKRFPRRLLPYLESTQFQW